MRRLPSRRVCGSYRDPIAAGLSGMQCASGAVNGCNTMDAAHTLLMIYGHLCRRSSPRDLPLADQLPTAGATERSPLVAVRASSLSHFAVEGKIAIVRTNVRPPPPPYPLLPDWERKFGSNLEC